MTQRWLDLLEAVGRAYEEGRSPFSHDFLVQHQVTAAECIDLEKTLSIMVFGYLSAPGWIRNAFLAGGALYSNGDKKLSKAVWHHLRLQEILKKLQAGGAP
jgi:hypothetical protein